MWHHTRPFVILAAGLRSRLITTVSGRESYAAVFGLLSFFAGELLPLARGAGMTNSDP